MCALCDPPGSAWPAQVSRHAPLPGRGDPGSPAGYRGWGGGASRPLRCRVLAAGAAVTVALSLAWAGMARIMSVPAIPGSPAVRAMALVGFAGDGPQCLTAHVTGPGRVRGPDQLRHGVDGLRQQLARAAHSLLTGSGVGRVPAPADHGPLAGDATLIPALGAHHVSTMADSACLPADGGSPVRHPAVSSQRPSGPARPVIRILAVRIPMPGRHARLGRGKPMAVGGAGGMQRPDAASVPGHDGIGLVSDVGPGRPDGPAAALPPGLFGGIPPPGCAAAGAGSLSLAAAGRPRGARHAATSAGAAVPSDAVTAPACRDARPGTG
jgi:hypothetical protein